MEDRKNRENYENRESCEKRESAEATKAIKINKNGKENTPKGIGVFLAFLEAPPGFEPGDKGFADLGLTTWL